MSQDLVFYTNPMSRGRIVRWMLEETGAAYETVVLEYGGSMKASDYLAINPMGKVPAILHKGRVVTEAAAICAYLADAFPEAGLAPPPDERAAYYRWFFYAAGPVEAATTNKSLGVTPTTEQQAMAESGSLASVLDTLEYAVSQAPYLGGDKFSAVDVYAGSQIGWGLQFGTLERRKALADYWERISARPAKARADKIDDALVRA